jgi:hypothetical protein
MDSATKKLFKKEVEQGIRQALFGNAGVSFCNFLDNRKITNKAIEKAATVAVNKFIEAVKADNPPNKKNTAQ